MEKIKKSLKNVKLEIRPSPVALKVLLIVLILFSTAALAALRWVHNGIQAQTENLRAEAAAVEYANSVLEQKKADLGSVQSIQDIAKEELGLVNPDTVVIDPQ
ncbi:MAG: hypothetical protein PUJ12_03400 [Oscillospiraceae bacterium]|nr:hypothetical protein [bacterium]MDD7673824.1 hypothetical protein [Oscillospiraceae bacterium]